MKTTIDIPDDVMKQAMRIAKTDTKRDAVLFAMNDVIRRAKVRQILSRLGKSKTFMTQEELMDMRLERGKYASR